MINYQSEVIVNRPVEQVFKFAKDVARFDDWMEMTGTHLVSGSSLRLGAQIETTLKMGPKKQTMIFQVAELDENRKLRWNTVSNGAMEWDADFTFESHSPSSTRVISAGQIQLKGILKLSEPLLADEVRSGEAKELVKFKELVEGLM